MVLKAYSFEIQYRHTKGGFWEDLEAIFSKAVLFIVWLSVCLNICSGCKLHKNWSLLTKFDYVFAVSDLSLCIKKCDCMLDIFYLDTSKFSIFIFIYTLLSISLCDNNGFNYRFLTTIIFISTHAENGFLTFILISTHAENGFTTNITYKVKKNRFPN